MQADQKELTVEEIKALARPINLTKRKKAAGHSRPPTFREPRGQFKGQIREGPKQWIVCTPCSQMFSTKENPRRIGIRARHAAKHLADHRMGRIKRPTEPKAKK